MNDNTKQLIEELLLEAIQNIIFSDKTYTDKVILITQLLEKYNQVLSYEKNP